LQPPQLIAAAAELLQSVGLFGLREARKQQQQRSSSKESTATVDK
jgi:hypothetical protein